MYSQKNCKLHKFATTNRNFKKLTLSDMHHRKTYMYINFQQKLVSRSVKTVHINLFAKICNLQSNFFKNHAPPPPLNMPLVSVHQFL